MNCHETAITVRFSEVDSYRVAWHGHYVAWMEVGRNSLAGRFGLDADSIAAAGYLAPVVSLELSYLRPVAFNDELTVRTRAERNAAATIVFNCEIVRPDGSLAARGKTVHVLTDYDGVLQFRLPPVIGERLERLFAWQEEQ